MHSPRNTSFFCLHAFLIAVVAYLLLLCACKGLVPAVTSGWHKTQRPCQNLSLWRNSESWVCASVCVGRWMDLALPTVWVTWVGHTLGSHSSWVAWTWGDWDGCLEKSGFGGCLFKGSEASNKHPVWKTCLLWKPRESVNWSFDGRVQPRNALRSPNILSIALREQGVVFLNYVLLRMNGRLAPALALFVYLTIKWSCG